MSWVKEKLGNRIKVISGYAFKSSDFLDCSNDNIPVIKIKNIKNGYVDIENDIQYVSKDKLNIDSKYIVNNGDILISLTGSQITQPNSVVGRIAKCYFLKGQICLLNQRAGKFLVNESQLDKNFLFYLLSYEKYKQALALMGHGAASQANISPSQVESLEIFLPNDTKEQNKIARILSNYDDLIENNNRRIKILEEMAHKIYKEWFVDFKFPGHETATFKDSPLDKIPNDWKVGIIKDINDVKGGYAFKSKDLKENGKFGIIKIKNIQAGNIDTNMCQYIDEKLAQKASDFKLNAGDILIAMTGAQVGKVGIMPQTKQVYYLNQRVAKFIPNKDFIINNQYLAIYTQTEKFNIQINNIASGAAQPNISASQIENIEILVPKAEIISAFENFINPNLKEAQILKNKNENLKQTRDLLLPRLISGEINVESMEII